MYLLGNNGGVCFFITRLWREFTEVCIKDAWPLVLYERKMMKLSKIKIIWKSVTDLLDKKKSTLRRANKVRTIPYIVKYNLYKLVK